MIVPIESIVTHSNVRLEVGDISDLAASIDRLGLLSPLLVAPRGDEYELIAGHRRLAALKKIGETDIPVELYLLMEEDSDRRIIQYHENADREDLTALEIAQVTMDLKNDGLNQKQIATELDMPVSQVSSNQKIARTIPKERRADVNLFSGQALSDLVDRTDGDSELADDALGYMLDPENPRAGWSAVNLAVSDRQEANFLDEASEFLKDLATAGVSIKESAPQYDEKWFPIATWPTAGNTKSYGGRNYGDVDLDLHRDEPCHAAWIAATYNEIVIVEACVDPSRHTKRGKSKIKVANAKGNATDPERERQKEQTKAKKDRKAEAGVWLKTKSPSATDAGALDPYLAKGWHALLNHDLCVKIVGALNLEKVYPQGGYSAKATVEKHVKEKYVPAASRLAYVCVLMHTYEYINGYAYGGTPKELGLP